MAAVDPRATNDLGADHVYLLEEERGTGVGFFRLGDPVLGRPALYDVGDVDLFSLESRGGDHVVEELAGTADKGQALRVLVGSWSLAHKHETRVGVAVAKDDLVAAGAERATGTVADFTLDRAQRFGTAWRSNEGADGRL